MKAITYRVDLLQPVLMTTLEGDPNSAVSFSYLPGSALQGALIRRYREVHPKVDIALDPDARRLFFTGATRILNGYPLMALDEQREVRTLARPLSWQHPKEDECTLLDFAVDEPDPGQQYQGFSEPFCLIDARSAILAAPSRRVQVHTHRDRQAGRPRSNSGGIFRYDALEAGQSFAAAILCEDTDCPTLYALLGGEDGLDVSLGGSLSAEYGKTRISGVAVVDDWCEGPGSTAADSDALDGWEGSDEEWDAENEVPGDEPEALDAGSAGDGEPAAEVDSPIRVVVTLLGNLLLCNDAGQYCADPCVFASELERCGSLSPRAITLEKAFARSEVVGGFNRRWGLPLPQRISFKMGSVFVFTTTRTVAEKLVALASRGLGDRRAVGFGSFAVEMDPAAPSGIREPFFRKHEPVSLDVDPQSKALARAMAKRILVARLETLIAERSKTLLLTARVTPSKAQLSRLRKVILSALGQSPEEGRQRVREFTEDLDSRAKSREQWDKGRIGGLPLLEWVRYRIADGMAPDETTGQRWSTGHSHPIWRELGLQDPHGNYPRLPAVGTVRAPIKDERLIYQTNLRLIDAVLARAAKAMRKGMP